MTGKPALVLCGVLCSATAAAQTAGDRDGQRPATRTSLSFELVTQSGAISSLAAQQWGQAFQKLGHSVRVRQFRAGDEEKVQAVTESRSGGLRLVRAVGVLDRDGRIHFGSASFALRDSPRLKIWIDELQAYGAAGDPAGQPMWGLDKKQFDAFFDGLSSRATAEVQGQSLDQALPGLELPKQYAVQWDPAAREWLRGRPVEQLQVKRSLAGYSRATALAIMLNDVGLGYLPRRQPDGGISILIERVGQRPLWPVGWEPKLSAYKTAPQLFKQINIQDVDDVPIQQLFGIVSQRSGVPVLMDGFAIRRKGSDPDAMRVTFKPKRLSWNRILQSAAIRNHLSYAVRIDELGMPFVWISTPEVARARKDRFGAD